MPLPIGHQVFLVSEPPGRGASAGAPGMSLGRLRYVASSLDAGHPAPDEITGRRHFGSSRKCICRVLWTIALMLTFGCERGEDGAPDRGRNAVEHPVHRLEAGPFSAGEGVLYLADSGQLEPLVALPGAGTAPDTLEGCALAIPPLGEEGFKRLVLSPEGTRAAWQTVGPGSCVGVVGGAGEEARVLDRWSAAVPDSLLWAPGGRHLAVLLTHPDAARSLAVFDTRTGRRLTMPWEADCEERGDCDVSRVEWVGGSLLDVEIRQGPAEGSVPYEVNVSMAGSGPVTEEK